MNRPVDHADRLIVTLDVSTHDDAVRLVDTLDNVAFFKIDRLLFPAGDLLGLLDRLQKARGNRGKMCLDLKTAGDIDHAIASFAARARMLGV